MGALWGLALAAALLAPGSARAEDLVGDFGRFADASRAHPDAAAVPLGAAFAVPSGARPASLSLTPSNLGRSPVAAPVPPPSHGAANKKQAAARTSEPRRSRSSARLVKGAILVAAGGLLLVALRPEKATRAATLAESWTPPPTWRREWPPAAGPASLPPLRLDGPGPDARLPQRPPFWWGITDAERDAIARWDLSPEKEFHKVPLDRWLDAHQSELKDVNIWRLKEKLWRDV